jgi:hypothetical protein
MESISPPIDPISAPTESISPPTDSIGGGGNEKQYEFCRLTFSFYFCLRSRHLLTVGWKEFQSATSWIDGYFLFDNRSLEYIMRELARWYDIEVFFVDSDKQNEYYSFEIERSSSLKQVMNILEKPAIR